MATKTTITDSGLRYKNKEAGSAFGSSMCSRSCYVCPGHTKAKGLYKSVMGKSQFFCSQECVEKVFPKKKIAV